MSQPTNATTNASDRRRLTSPEMEASSISIAHILRTIAQYGRVIFLSLVTVLFAYTIIAVGIYIASPAIVTTSLPFRLAFEGAERGEYPNGLKFSTAEIVSTPVLTRVFEANNLGRYVTYSEFKDSVFVVESNRELEQLEAEYRSRLSDPKLTPVDRERVIREYEQRAESIRHTDYALVLAEESVVRRLPGELRQKILAEILSNWATVADTVKGALKYRLPVLTAAIVESQPVDGELIIGLDILRSRVNRILANIDELLRIPGAETVRVGPEKISLAEIRVTLEDVRRFHVEPLIMQIHEQSLINDPRIVKTYFETQLAVMDRELQAARSRVEMLQSSFGTYVGRPSQGSMATGRDPGPGTYRQGDGIPSDQAVPQLSDSFLERLSRMVAETRDIQYRQALLDRVNEEALQRLVPVEKELQYYTAVTRQMQTNPRQSDAAQKGAQLASINQSRGRVLQQVMTSVQRVGEVYDAISKNLNPDTMLYTRTAPMKTTSARTVSISRLIVIGLGVFLLSVPIILMACLIHARMRAEDEVLYADEPGSSVAR